MYSPKIKSDSLRKKLQDLGLREDDGGYWYYEQFSKDWMIATYEDYVKIAIKGKVDKNGDGYFELLGDQLNCIDDEEKILEQVSKLLNKVKRLELTKKKNKMKMRMIKLKTDF